MDNRKIKYRFKFEVEILAYETYDKVYLNKFYNLG